jgi:hypothetical protein
MSEAPKKIDFKKSKINNILLFYVYVSLKSLVRHRHYMLSYLRNYYSATSWEFNLQAVT